jgi:hypothetical protein
MPSSARKQAKMEALSRVEQLAVRSVTVSEQSVVGAVFLRDVTLEKEVRVVFDLLPETLPCGLIDLKIPSRGRPNAPLGHRVSSLGTCRDRFHGEQTELGRGTRPLCKIDQALLMTACRAAYPAGIQVAAPRTRPNTTAHVIVAFPPQGLGESVLGMLSLETLGFYSDEEHS